MFYIILIIFHFSICLVKCENVSVAIPAEMPKTSIELMTEQIGETMAKLDTKQLQPKFISLRNVLDGIRFLVKGVVNSYNWYQPELELGGCVMKYTRTMYPELMQMRFSYENISTYLRSLYTAICDYIIEMINENRQDIQIEHQRIGLKVAEMTLYNGSSSSSSQPPPPTTTTTLSLANASPSVSSSRPINHVKSSLHNYNDGNFNYAQKFHPILSNHPANNLNPNFSITQRRNDKNELAEAQSFNDFFPRTRSMYDLSKFDKNDFLSIPINSKDYGTNKSVSLQSQVPFDWEKFETKHSDNYTVLAAESSSSSSIIQSTTSAANIFDLPETDKNEKFPETLVEFENNLNVEEKRDAKQKKYSIMYIGPRHFSTDYQDDMSPSLDDAPTLHLNKNDEKGDDDSNISDFESAILESLGFNVKAVKSSQLARCVRSYIKDLSRRTFEYFILM